MRISSGPSAKNENPRSGAVSWYRLTPRSASRPSSRLAPAFRHRFRQLAEAALMKSNPFAPCGRVPPRHLQRLRVPVVGDHQPRRQPLRDQPRMPAQPGRGIQVDAVRPHRQQLQRFRGHDGYVHTPSHQPVRDGLVHIFLGHRRRRCLPLFVDASRSIRRSGHFSPHSRTGCSSIPSARRSSGGNVIRPCAVHLRFHSQIRGIERQLLGQPGIVRYVLRKSSFCRHTEIGYIWAICGPNWSQTASFRAGRPGIAGISPAV